MGNLKQMLSDLSIYFNNFYLSLKKLKVRDVYDARHCYFVSIERKTNTQLLNMI